MGMRRGWAAGCGVEVVLGALLVAACTSADEARAGCRLDDAEGVRIEDAVLELRPDESGNLVGRARLAASFTDESFGYVEAYQHDEGLDVRVVGSTLLVAVVPAESQWHEDNGMGLIRVWERPAPECGRFATIKMSPEAHQR